jgi:hypothetical protein
MQTAASTNQQQSDGGFGELAALPLPDTPSHGTTLVIPARRDPRSLRRA